MKSSHLVSSLRLLHYAFPRSSRMHRVCGSKPNFTYAIPQITSFHTLQPFRAPVSKLQQPSVARPAPRRPQNEDIKSFMIQIVNENGSLDPPVRTRDVLKSLDRREFILIQVGEGMEGQPPVCKIVGKVALRE